MNSFGKYTLLRRIGTGGMAEVFLARTTVAQGLAKVLVVKKIHPAFARSRQFEGMFVNEAKIALGLNHPNIVQVFDFGQVGDSFYLAMEYVEGLDLLRLMHEASKKKERIPYGLCAHIIQQVAKALDYAHRKTDEYGQPLGIVHRDISPQNVLLSWDGAVKLVDFGIARARHVHEEEGVVKGKFAYMAPEQARGEPVDRRADVYSAGVVLFETCTARALFAGQGKEILDKVKASAIPRPRNVNPEIPAELEGVILRALAFRREDRFQTGRDFQNALGQFQFHNAADNGGVMPDSGSLARFIAQVIPSERRRVNPRPPTAAPAAGREGAPAPQPQKRARTVLPGLPPLTGNVEKKHVFVLKAQVRGSAELEEQHGPNRTARVLNDFAAAAEDLGYKHDAFIDRSGPDELTFVVGLPVAADDDATRAIRLGLALIETLDGICEDVSPGLRLAVGVQRGVAVVRGKSQRKVEFELGASTTDIATRLAEEAHGGEILCGGAVYRLAQSDWNFEELATIELTQSGDGGDSTTAETSADPKRLRIYRLRSAKERAQRLRERSTAGVVLFGRDLEMRALRDAYRDVLVNRQQRPVLVIGEPGMGKSALVGAFLHSLPPEQVIVVRGSARAASADTPLGLVADIARDILGLAEAAEPKEVERRLRRAAALLYDDAPNGPDVTRLVEAAGMVLGLPADDDSDTLDADERRQRLLRAFARFEEKYDTDRPAVLLIEDMHWADPQSLKLFGDLLKKRTRRAILAILTARTDARVKQVAEVTKADIIRLTDLGREDRLALVSQRFAPGDSVEELAEQIVARAGGNPFFINEMIDALAERGSLVPDESDSSPRPRLRWVDRDVPLNVPTSVAAVVATRIDRLPEGEKAALLSAAVLGRRFRASAVDEISGTDHAQNLQRLRDRGLLVEDGEYLTFRDEMTQTVAYELLPADARQAAHGEIARRMVLSRSYRRGQSDAVIARHLELAGDAESAAKRYLLAAEHALDVGGNPEAFRLLTRALRLLPESDHERRFAAHCQREEILRRLARRREQRRELRLLMEEAKAHNQSAALAQAYGRMAHYHIDVNEQEEALEAAGPALEHARASGDPLAEAEALRLHAAIARGRGEFDRALELIDRALELCGVERSALHQRATVLNDRGATLRQLSRMREASEAYAEALVIYRALRLPRLESRTLNALGELLSALGELEDALAHYKSSLKLDKLLGDRAHLSRKLTNIGHVYCRLGDLERAERYLKKAAALCEHHRDSRGLADTLLLLSDLYRTAGRTSIARPYAERALDQAQKSSSPDRVLRAQLVLALLAVDAGQATQEDLARAREATDAARKSARASDEVTGIAVQGLLLCALGSPEDGVALTAQAREMLNDEVALNREEILLYHARAAKLAGREGDARDALAEAEREIARKAAALQDRQLRELYENATVPRAVRTLERQLAG